MYVNKAGESHLGGKLHGQGADLAWRVQESQLYSFEKKLTIENEIFVIDKLPVCVFGAGDNLLAEEWKLG